MNEYCFLFLSKKKIEEEEIIYLYMRPKEVQINIIYIGDHSPYLGIG